ADDANLVTGLQECLRAPEHTLASGCVIVVAEVEPPCISTAQEVHMVALETTHTVRRNDVLVTQGYKRQPVNRTFCDDQFIEPASAVEVPHAAHLPAAVFVRKLGVFLEGPAVNVHHPVVHKGRDDDA